MFLKRAQRRGAIKCGAWKGGGSAATKGLSRPPGAGSGDRLCTSYLYYLTVPVLQVDSNYNSYYNSTSITYYSYNAANSNTVVPVYARRKFDLSLIHI